MLAGGRTVPPAAVAALVGLRRNLFPEAPPLQTASQEAGT
jgi:hypothetical protein